MNKMMMMMIMVIIQKRRDYLKSLNTATRTTTMRSAFSSSDNLDDASTPTQITKKTVYL